MTMLTRDEIADLLLLVHDKDHCVHPDRPLPALERALEAMSEVCEVPLYRGLHSADFASSRYLSFSEDFDTAARFARAHGSGLVASVVGARGFCYWRWLVEEQRRIRSLEAGEADREECDLIVEMAEQEREWVILRTEADDCWRTLIEV